MGIQIEFNPDLALRNIEAYKRGQRELAECIPEKLEAGKLYPFLKKGLRNYWLEGELPLVETMGNQQLSRPRASIIIKEVVHFMMEGKLYTRGQYEVKAVFDTSDLTIHFDGFARIK